MLLSHRYQFLFVHIAKTGGTSVRAALNPLRWRDPLYYLSFPAHKISGFTGHKLGLKFPRHAHIIAAKEMLPEEYFNKLYKFAFVRNPWDLQVSSFHHIKRERPDALNGYTDFKSFMRYKFDPERAYQYHIDTSLSLQSDYLVDLRGELCVDFLGHYENLQQDFNQVCQTIGIQTRTLPQQRVDKTRQQDYRTYYDDQTIELVATHFKKDCELLAYRYE